MVQEVRAVQLEVIKAIAPDQDNKGFWDASFHPIMVRCGGNPEASFANALGLDSFQFLALEYTRLATLGMRASGNARIFHGMNIDLPAGSLAETTTQAAVRYTAGSDDAQCLSAAQEWARSILLGTHSDHAALQQALIASEDLARATARLAGQGACRAPSCQARCV